MCLSGASESTCMPVCSILSSLGTSSSNSPLMHNTNWYRCYNNWLDSQAAQIKLTADQVVKLLDIFIVYKSH